MARTPLIAGNWKMNKHKADAADLVKGLVSGLGDKHSGVDVLVCPPAIWLDHVRAEIVAQGGAEALETGAQDCHSATSGAHTGDIAAPMIADSGARYVIVGHSERRQDHGEGDVVVMAKARAAHEAELIAIVCVGETREERDAGDTLSVIERQVKGSLPTNATAANTVIAYEPVWAIGTGLTATPEDAQAVHAHIRAVLMVSHGEDVADKMRILYGGSMKPDNAVALLGQQDIDGGLIGGASLKAEDFLKIVDAAV